MVFFFESVWVLLIRECCAMVCGNPEGAVDPNKRSWRAGDGTSCGLYRRMEWGAGFYSEEEALFLAVPGEAA